MKSFAIALVATIFIVQVMGVRNPTQHIVANLQAHKSMAKLTAHQVVDKYFAKAMVHLGEEYECQDECQDWEDQWQEYPWEECMGCWDVTCRDECDSCWDLECPEMQNECWDSCERCYDPVGCFDLWENCGDWEEDRECWDAITVCWESTHPCKDDCPPTPKPDQECEDCWRFGDDDFIAPADPCSEACAPFREAMDEAKDNYPYEECHDCYDTTCVEECDCSGDRQNEECWNGCNACWDPEGCWVDVECEGGDQECWDAHMQCYEETQPCAGACPPWPKPSKRCEDCWNTGVDSGKDVDRDQVQETEDDTDDFECNDECENVIESWEHVDEELCMDCLFNTCVAECEMCDWEDENDPCWDGCLACWDPESCNELSDMGQDEEWATEAEALDCWVHTNPCADACEGMEAPSEGCLVCLDNNGYMEHNMKNALNLKKVFNKLNA